MDNSSFLGQGMQFPISVNPATGRINTVSGLESVRESIYLILNTAKTERLIRPDFGASLEQYTFMDVTRTTLSILTRNLTSLIMEQEPRISTLDVQPEPDLDNGRLIINIRYQVSGDYTVGSLVFPFYLNERGEKEPEEYDDLIEFNEESVDE